MKWLTGKKTHLGSIAAGLLAAIYGLDQMIDPDVAWKIPYTVIAGLIASWTGVNMRLAVKKAER